MPINSSGGNVLLDRFSLPVAFKNDRLTKTMFKQFCMPIKFITFYAFRSPFIVDIKNVVMKLLCKV